MGWMESLCFRVRSGNRWGYFKSVGKDIVFRGFVLVGRGCGSCVLGYF